MDAPSEFKQFHQVFQELSYTREPLRVFEDFLDFIIRGFSLDESILWDKNYSENEILLFNELLVEWISLMNQKVVIEEKAWFDFFGIYYEAELLSQSSKQGNGIFFTPANVTDLMTLLNTEEDNGGKLINDPSAGSGRCLISHHARNPGNFYVAQDLNLTCVKMCIANFLIHGVSGDVIHGNTLSNEFFSGWRVNGSPHIYQAPHVRALKDYELGLKIAAAPGVEKVVSLDDFIGEVGK